MAFWSRLRGVGTSSPKRNPSPNAPQHRLVQFKRAYNDLLQLWRNGDSVPTDAITAESIRIRLSRLAELLNDDLRGPTPHLCITLAASSRLLVTVFRIASSFYNDGIIHEALGICGLLIDCEEESFLEDRGFADALTTFIDKVVDFGPLAGDIEVQSLVVEVLFGIASRARVEPTILPTWFRPKEAVDINGIEDQSTTDFNGPRREDFPLLYLLLHHIPDHGRTGEFARMGVLYIIESASHSEILERWLVESDMAQRMASGLGALYSQLSRKLILSYTEDENPVILSFSEIRRDRSSSDAEETTSPSYQAHLRTFLAYLVFWQDLVEHCTSFDVRHTLLDHFKFLFLQQLLYPSLLESSDFDGGSSVAVLTYLRHILESIEHPDLVGSIFEYLLAQPKSSNEPTPSTRPTTLARRRKSQNLIESLSTEEQKPSPDLFTLVDLLLTSLQGRNQQAITATLQLSSVLLRKFHTYTFSTLVKAKPIVVPDDRRTIANHQKNINTLWTMMNSVSDAYMLENSYEGHIHDAHMLTESHPCSTSLHDIPDMTRFVNESQNLSGTVSRAQSIRRHRITQSDPFLYCVLVQLKYFFFNDIDTNLGLTQVVIDLASCGLTQLEGWLLGEFVSDDDENYTDSEQRSHALTDDGATIASSLVPEQSMPHSSHMSPMFDTLESLIHQVDQYRQEIMDFDSHLQELRKKLANSADVGLGTEPTDTFQKPPRFEASTPVGLHRTIQTPPTPGHPASETILDSASRSSSPRGRQSNSISTMSLVGRLNHLHISPSRSSSQSTSRTYSASPLRNTSINSMALKSTDVPKGAASLLLRRINLLAPDLPSERRLPPADGSETSSTRSMSIGSEKKTDETKDVALGHLLTNVIVLQEFILELTAVVEVRTSLFDEVLFAE